MNYLQIAWKNQHFLWTLPCGWWERIDEKWRKTREVPEAVQTCLRENLDNSK